MVRIVNGEIVKDDPASSPNRQSGPSSPPFPQAWSSSNQNAQQYQYIHPEQPQNQNYQGGTDWGQQLEQTRIVFGYPVPNKVLLLIAVLLAFGFGLQGVLVFALIVYLGSTETARRLFQRQPRANTASASQGGAPSNPFTAFFSSLLTPPPAEPSPDEQQGQQPRRTQPNQGGRRLGTLDDYRAD